MPKPCSR